MCLCVCVGVSVSSMHALVLPREWIPLWMYMCVCVRVYVCDGVYACVGVRVSECRLMCKYTFLGCVCIHAPIGV